MTSTTVSSAPKEKDSVPVYKRKEIPEHLQHLCTTTELKAQWLKPAEGQEPVALLRGTAAGTGGASSRCTTRAGRRRCGRCQLGSGRR